VALLLVLPVVLVLNLVPEDSLLGDQGLGGWSLLSHLWFFVSGFVIASHSRIQHSLERLRWVWLLAALALTGGQIALWAARGASGYDFEFEHTDLLSYLWMFAWLGFAGRHLRFSTPLLQRANEAVLPFYILHQTVLLSVGYFGVRWAMPDGARWAAITVISLALCLGLYEWLIRRFNALRFLFGMKPLARPAAVAARSPVAAAEPTH
jgi:peptidoglycan/LPS O-acetylase OafA/YrhL